MDLDIDLCRSVSGKWGLPLDFVVKEFHLFDVLGQITMETAPSQSLVFKGGTALNKVYLGELQRFSEDLDFDLKDATLKEVEAFSRSLASKLKGYEITEFRRVRGTFHFECSFEFPSGKKDHVRVDIAGKKLVTAEPLAVGTARSAFTDRFVTGFYVYSLDDLVARKLHALVDRTEGKDIYDVATAIGRTIGLKKAVKTALESEGKSANVTEFFQTGVAKLRSVNFEKIKQLTNPLIPSANRPRDWKIFIDTLADKLESYY